MKYELHSFILLTSALNLEGVRCQKPFILKETFKTWRGAA
jgi:hypothetical protein